MKENLLVDVYPSKEPEIGRWLWALQDTRHRTLRELDGVSQAAIDWLPGNGESTLGTVLYHIADIEADYLYVEVLERSFPPDVAAFFPFVTRDQQGHLTQVHSEPLEGHLKRLEFVRGLLLHVFQSMDLDDFRRARSFPQYDVTPEWVLYHLMQHEDEHRSQIVALRARAERNLGR